MEGLGILSPHFDDAAFSLCLSLARWCSLQMKVRVVNVFTVSAYGPRMEATDRLAVSSVREGEDRRVTKRIGAAISIESLRLLDAPIRLHINVGSVFQPESSAPQHGSGNEEKSLACWIRMQLRERFVMAPLGLGNHIDHLLVKAAAEKALASHKLAFYEDLPYAAWTTEAALHERIAETERKIGALLRPVVIRSKNAIPRKRRIITGYQSQISPEEAAMIARFAGRYGGGERIWIPKHSKSWQDLACGANEI